MDELSQQEVEDIQRIIVGFLQKEYGDQADAMLDKLAGLLQDPGVKLVHFGNTVFLVIFAQPRVAEIHTMSLDEDSNTLAKHFVSLAKFLQNIGFVEAYSYSDDPRFMAVAKRTRLPIQTETVNAQDGKQYTVYRLRFE